MLKNLSGSTLKAAVVAALRSVNLLHVMDDQVQAPQSPNPKPETRNPEQTEVGAVGQSVVV